MIIQSCYGNKIFPFTWTHVDDKFLHATISADNENICMLILLRSFQRKVIVLRSKIYNKLSRSTFLLPNFFVTIDNINEIVIGQV